MKFIRRLIARATGLFTNEDVELIILERCRKMKEVQERKRRETFRLLARNTETLLSCNTLSGYSFFGVFTLLTRDNTLLWAIAKIPLSETSTAYQPYYRSAEIEVIDPASYSPFAIQDRIAFLNFDIKGPVVHIVDILTVCPRKRQGIGTFILRLMEHLAAGIGVEKIVGELSPADLPNREIQIAFYTKNGFTIHFHGNNKESGWIEKRLSPGLAKN